MSKKHYLSNEDISILCSELASVVSSGLTITDGILVILQDGEDKNKAALLEKILRSIETGSSITRAFDKTEVFPNYFIKMLEVGESTGRLDTVLASLADYYASIDEISTSIKSAIAYPSVLLIIVFAVIILLSVYVLPIFSDVFAQLGLTLPDSAQWIMSVGGVISDVAILIIGILAFVIILGVVLYNFVRPFQKSGSSCGFSHENGKNSVCRKIFSRSFNDAFQRNGYRRIARYVRKSARKRIYA